MARTPDEGVQNTRPPVLLGCMAAVALVVAVFGSFAFLIVFLESGADTGKVRLEDAEAYAPGSVEFIGEENLFLVRLADGAYLALADLDAPNRARTERRCRVAPLQPGDARLPGILERYGAAMSDDATGSTLVFREECGGAMYDVTGLRLDAEGRNLDRYPVSIDSAGRVVVDTAKRQCSQREQLNPFAPAGCE